MPNNKNAFYRYIVLDKLLSDRNHCYSIGDLTEKCNEALSEIGIEVTKRCIEKDIVALDGAPSNVLNERKNVYADIERYTYEGKRCVRYANPHFSIFKKELKDEERSLLREVLNTLGQFEGLAHFEWIQAFRSRMDVGEDVKIISFSNNPYLQNSNLLGVLFDNISNQQVVSIAYHIFGDETRRETVVHPYLLKQYNERWFLLCAADEDGKMLTFALDRIDDVSVMPERKYRPRPDNLMERFEDIIGVTYYEDRLVEHITFWVSDKSKDYVTTKPIHASQTHLRGQRELQLREQYPTLDGGAFFTIDCIQNYELIRELLSFGEELVVLSPSSIQNGIFNRIQSMLDSYSAVRT